MPGSTRSQKLHGVNTTTSIDDNLLAPIKDPLWFLAMQWRTGEFEAENGGTPAVVEVDAVEHPLTQLDRGDGPVPLDPDVPLEYAIEREDPDEHTSAAWRSAALAYAFETTTDHHRLRVEDYPGDRLDWYHADLLEAPSADAAPDTEEEVTTHRSLPTTLRVRGAPEHRWWRFETADDEPIAPVDPEPNVLSTLLPEFTFIDGDDWFMVPLVQRAGSMRRITRVAVTDTFGTVTELGPAITSWRRGEWGVFVLAGDDAAEDACDGSMLFVPNIALDVLHNDDVEEVRFTRDEEANLVWAFERLVHDADGRAWRGGDRPAGDGDGGPADGDDEGGMRDGEGLSFVLADPVPAGWIPYVPRFLRPGSADDGELYLRRARTTEDTSDGPQHRSQIVGESWRLDEHEVPRTGVRVRRIRRSARGSDGQSYHWVGRSTQTGHRTAHPERRYDHLDGA